MDADELRALLSTEGMRLVAEVAPTADLDDVVRTVSRLRAAGHPPALVAAVLSQARLRRRAAARFGAFADRMLFTPDGLEQATRLRVAAVHAGRFAGLGPTRIADLGCGIGADAMAFAGLGLEVLAVERDEVTAAIAAFNLAPFPSARVVHGSAEDTDLDGVDAVWADPARRRDGRRQSDPGAWSPPLDAVLALAERLPLGVKLAPGLDRSLIPDDVEAQWVSEDRELVETTLWTGALSRPGIRRSALVLSAAGAAELTADSDSADAAVGDLGGWLYEPDPAVIRARLIGDLARLLGGRMLDRTIAWITSDERIETPFAQRFAVVEEYPLDLRAVRRELRGRGVGSLEVKTRGVDLDPAEVRARLALRGSESATLILTRRASRRVAILARRA